MYKYGVQLPKIILRSSLGAELYTLTFNYKHGLSELTLDQPPVYGAEVEMCDGSVAQHLRGYRATLSAQFTDHYLPDTSGADNSTRLGKSELGEFMGLLRGWTDSGGVIRVYPHRDTTDYFDAYIPSGGLTMTPRSIDGQPKTKITDYSLTLIAKGLTSTKWQGTAA